MISMLSLPQGVGAGTDFHALLALIDVLRDPEGAAKLLLQLAEAKAGSEAAARAASDAATRAQQERAAADRRIAELEALEKSVLEKQAQIEKVREGLKAFEF